MSSPAPRVQPLLASTFAALDATGVRWCLLRGRDRLDPPPGDVDLLVHPGDVRELRRVLLDAGWAPRRVWAAGTQNFFVAYDAARDRWLDLHAVTELGFGPLHAAVLPGAESVVTRHVRDDDVPCAAPADRFWVTLLHVLLDKQELAARHRAALGGTGLVAAPDDALAQALDARVGEAVAARLLALVGAQKWEELREAGRALLASWSRRDPTVAWRRLRNGVSLAAHRLIEPVTHPGVTVALLAPDGAGKSTLAEGLVDHLHVVSRRVYLGLEGGRFAGRGPSRFPGWGIATRLGHAWATQARAVVYRRRGWHVVYDRHPAEARRPPPGGGRDRVRSAVLGHSLPAPDVTIVLDAPAELLHARKPEHPVEQLEAARQRYLALADDLPRAVVVDATADPEQVRREVTAIVWLLWRARLT